MILCQKSTRQIKRTPNEVPDKNANLKGCQIKGIYSTFDSVLFFYDQYVSKLLNFFLNFRMMCKFVFNFWKGKFWIVKSNNNGN
jgi:hypothetical protein